MRDDGIFIGLDIGSQGVRALVVCPGGRHLARAQYNWQLHIGPEGWHEQDPVTWIDGVTSVLREIGLGLRGRDIRGIGVTSTSGTLVLADTHGKPCRPAIMWNDTRAGDEADELSEVAASLVAHTGARIRPSFPLAKLLWLNRYEHETLAQARHIMHASDWILWQLGGLGDVVSDPTNALKTGYDPVMREWIPFVTQMGWHERLPRIVNAGTIVGALDHKFAEAAGVPRSTPLVATMTDANTASLSAGVFEPGQWATTLGTGMSIKGLSLDPVADIRAGIYSHASPFGNWLVSGTSHSGAGTISQQFGTDPARLRLLNEQAQSIAPGSRLVYSLAGKGEFFPFWAPQAESFSLGSPSGSAENFRATLEGIAVVERLAYERLRAIGLKSPSRVISLGGATKSSLFNIIRASTLGVPLVLREAASSSLGAAMIAAIASGCSPREAVADMGGASHAIEPDRRLMSAYEGVFASYIEEFSRRGYLGEPLSGQIGARVPFDA